MRVLVPPAGPARGETPSSNTAPHAIPPYLGVPTYHLYHTDHNINTVAGNLIGSFGMVAGILD